MFDEKKYYATLYMTLYDQNIDPRSLKVWVEKKRNLGLRDLDRGINDIFVYQQIKHGDEEFYVAYRVGPDEYSDWQWFELAAKRAAYLLRDKIFPNKYEQLVFLHKKMDEFDDQKSRR